MWVTCSLHGQGQEFDVMLGPIRSCCGILSKEQISAFMDFYKEGPLPFGGET